MEPNVYQWLESPQAENIIATFNSSIILLGFLITAFQISQNRKIHIERLDWEKKTLTVSVLNEISQINAAAVTVPFQLKDRKVPIPISEIQQKIEDDPEIGKAISRYLSYYERISFLCRSGVYDRTMIVELRAGIILRAYIAFKDYIEYRRKISSSRRAYKQLELFAKSLDNYSVFLETGALPSGAEQVLGQEPTLAEK